MCMGTEEGTIYVNEYRIGHYLLLWVQNKPLFMCIST